MGKINIIKGKSGSGKTFYICNKIKEIRLREPHRKIIVVVPEQYTHSMERMLIENSSDDVKKKGLLHTEVLSFTRLSHRILGELGGENRTVLSEVGRTLLVRHVTGGDKVKLKFFSNNLKMNGYIEEIKSFISELMQYDIKPDRLDEIIKSISADKVGRGSLTARLGDISSIYKAYTAYMEKNELITSDGIIDLATSLLNEYPDEETLLDNSIVYFDGFTGFEPLQLKFLLLLIRRASEVTFTITMDTEELYGRSTRRLFKLGLDTERNLLDIADSLSVSPVNYIDVRSFFDAFVPKTGYDDGSVTKDLSSDIVTGGEIPPRFKEAPDIAALEAGLFRTKYKKYKSVPENISINVLRKPEDEIDWVITEIMKLRKEDSTLHYSDIAVIAGNPESYGITAAGAMKREEIPVFVDLRKNLSVNPAVQFILTLFKTFISDFEHHNVIKLIRTGFLFDISEEEKTVDELDNFLYASGIRGISMWKKEWNTVSYSKDEEISKNINRLREKIIALLEPVYMDLKKAATVSKTSDVLMGFLNSSFEEGKRPIKECLLEREASFQEKGEIRLSLEMGQLYDSLEKLVNDMDTLLGSEKVSTEEYYNLFLSGISAMSVAVIPPEDAVIFGDSGRTRVGNVKYLFFIGVTDSSIPKGSYGGGLISDEEREYMTGLPMEDGKKIKLAGTALERIDEDEFHLYMNLTKAERKIFISYPDMDEDDRKVNPAYLINRIKAIFPLISINHIGRKNLVPRFKNVPGKDETDGKPGKTDEMISKTDRISRLDSEVVEGLYSFVDEEGNRIPANLSISQLEKFASCPYMYYLMYGLRLSERKEHKVSFADIGDIMHGALDGFVKKMHAEGKDWNDYSDDVSFLRVAESSFSEAIQEYKKVRMYSSDRNEYLFNRYKDTFYRTVLRIKEQMLLGEYNTMGSEVAYSIIEPVKLKGIIDRVDTAEGKRVIFDDDGIPHGEDCTYVKVVDYKTGTHKVSLTELYYGVQIQMIIYLGAANDIVKEKSQNKKMVIPAGVFYYNIDDSYTDIETASNDDYIKVIPNGMYDGNLGSIKALDTTMVEGSDIPEALIGSAKSKAIRLLTKKDGSISSSCLDSIATAEELEDIIDYGKFKINELSKKRSSGDIEIRPFRLYSDGGAKEIDTCRYCKYTAICRFSNDIEDCRLAYKESKERTLYLMKKEMGDASWQETGM